MKPTNPVLLSVLLSLGCVEAFGPQKVLLSRIDTLTLRNDMVTKARRVAPIPQLKCVGGDGMGKYEVDVMRCKNRGSDYGDENISWSCTADLPREFKLGATDVICEGYDSPDDNYILKGSCGVEYRLALTDYGYEKYGSAAWTNRFTNDNSTSTNIILVIFWTIFFSILGLIIYSACTSASTGRAPRAAGGGRPSFWGGGGGGGGGYDQPPPPPPPYDSDSKPWYSQRQQQGPGFWTGAATGAAAGAAASRLFSGGGGNRRERVPSPAQSSSSYSASSWGSSEGESSTGGARHSSTGFGQTRRR